MFEHSITENISIVAPIEEVYSIIVDPTKVSFLMPGVIENTDIPPLPLKVGDRFTYHFKMFNMILIGNWVIDVLEPPCRYESSTDGDEQSTWKYQLQNNYGSTEIFLTINYSIPIKIISYVDPSVMKKINSNTAQLYLSNLKHYLEK